MAGGLVRRVATVLLACVLLAMSHGVHADGDSKRLATVYFTAGQFTVRENVLDPSGCAWGLFINAIEENGWARLFLNTSAACTDAQQAYAMGLVEGTITSELVYNHYLNMMSFTFVNGSVPPAVLKFFDEQDAFLTAEAAARPNDLLLQHASLLQQQWRGIVDGYNSQAEADKKLTSGQLQVCNAFGDLFDIVPAVTGPRPDFDRMTPAALRAFMYSHGHCSAFVRVTPDLSAMFSGHSAWFDYSAMTRILKSVRTNFRLPTAAPRMVYASYPATLGSNDDFYLTSAGLNVLETTNGILNNSLYDQVTPRGLLSFQRVIAASRACATGADWVQMFARYNAGTYNNQWIVVDYKQFQAGQTLLPGTVYIAEQIPGYVESSDRTNDLYLGYWPSYNIPAQQRVYELAGWPAFYEKYGDDFSWGMCPRAKLFRARAGTVTDVNSMQRFMRYNDYLHDPLSGGDPEHAICARGDLSSHPSKGGCYDSKITWSGAVPQLQMFGISGPTADDLPPFSWTGRFASDAHFGQPTVWNFAWEEFSASDWN